MAPVSDRTLVVKNEISTFPSQSVLAHSIITKYNFSGQRAAPGG